LRYILSSRVHAIVLISHLEVIVLALQVIGVWVAAAVVGAAGFPLLYLACPRLKDRGYSIARIASLAIVAFLSWMASSLRVFPFGSASAIASVILLAAVSIMVFRGKFREIGRFLVSNRKLIVSAELIGLAAFIIVLNIIACNPEIAPETERFMDYALLNRIDQTAYFPPDDPWFAGKTMNYYYYGWILLSPLHKLIPVPLPIFFNIALGLIYAFFIMASFGIGYNLSGKISYGILAAFLLMMMGNLYGFIQVMIPRSETIVAAAQGKFALFNYLRDYLAVMIKQFQSFGFFNGARVMVQTAQDGTILDYPINEFPLFSLVYGDLHPYAITYMVNMAILNLLLNIARGVGRGWKLLGENWLERMSLLGILSIMIGMLIGAHTWDYPVYLGVAVCLLAWGSLRRDKTDPPSEEKILRPTIWERLSFILPGASLALLSFALYLPFNLPFLREQAGHERGGLGTVNLTTPLELLLIALGIYLFFILAWLFARAITSRPSLARLSSPPVLIFLATALFLVLISGGLFAIPTKVFLALLVIYILYLLIASQPEADEGFIMIIFLAAICLALFCEFYFLIDHYKGGGYERMNTMFKLYTNIWLLFGAGALFAVYRINLLIRRRWAAYAWRTMVGLFLAAGFIYTWASVAALARAHPAMLPRTLDGIAYIKEPVPSWQKSEWRWNLADWKAIKWILENTEIDDIILQANGNAYDWAPRVATFTGRPTLVGWNNHEAGWRNDWKEPTRRDKDTKTIYTTTDSTRARTLIDDYGIDYLYLGPTERERYKGEGLSKLSSLGQRVYSSDEVKIYRVSSE